MLESTGTVCRPENTADFLKLLGERPPWSLIQKPSSNRSTAFERQDGRCFYCDYPMWRGALEPFALLHSLTPGQARQFQCTAEHLVVRQDGDKDGVGDIVAACWTCDQRRYKRKFAPEPTAYRGAKAGLAVEGGIRAWLCSMQLNYLAVRRVSAALRHSHRLKLHCQHLDHHRCTEPPHRRQRAPIPNRLREQIGSHLAPRRGSRRQGLLRNGFLHVVPLQRYGLTIAQGTGSAQHAAMVLSIHSACHQRRPDCGG